MPAVFLLQFSRVQAEGDRHELGADGKRDHQRHAEIVEDSHQPASQKPEDAEGAFKDSISRRPAAFRDDLGDDGFHDGFLRAHADAPEDDAKHQGRHGMHAENEDREKCGKQRGPDQNTDAPLIVPEAEDQRRDGIDEHGKRVEQGQISLSHKGTAGCDIDFGNMHGDQRVVDKSEGETADSGDVNAETFLHVEGLFMSRFRLEFFRVREFLTREDQKEQGQCARNRQHGKT